MGAVGRARARRARAATADAWPLAPARGRLAAQRTRRALFLSQRYMDCAWGCGARHLIEAEEEHRKVCPERLIDCPRECGARLKWREREEHKPLCPNRLELCIAASTRTLVSPPACD